MNHAPRPLASLVLISYRQEAFVEDALRGALAQDYPAMEIVFSDDASPDGTWDRAMEFLKRHQGDRQVVTRRASSNTGICGNIEEAVRLASGKYIVIAAGDDISLPSRISETVRAFEADPDVFALGCDFETMDLAGHPLGSLQGTVRREPCDAVTLASLGQNIGGAGAAYRREVFERFGPISRDTFNEDMVLEFRAALLGKTSLVPLRLVRQRLHSGSVTGAASAKVQRFDQYQTGARRMANSALKAYQNRLVDLETAIEGGLVAGQAAAIRAALQRHIEITRNVVDLHDGRLLAYLGWIGRLARGQMPLGLGLRVLAMAGFPRLWFWHISRRAKP